MKKRYALILIIVAGIAWFVFFLKQLHDNSSEALKKDHFEFTNTCPREYIDLFKPHQKIDLIGSNTNKWRFPITDFNYNGKFFVEIYKLGKISNRSLNGFIDEKYQDEHISFHQYYNIIEDNPVLDINYRSGDPIKIDNGFIFNITGKDTRSVTHSDSIYYYSSNLKNLSITYKANQNDKQELFIRSSENDEDSKTVPVQVMFLKRNNNLYFLLLCASDGVLSLKDNLLKDMIAE